MTRLPQRETRPLGRSGLAVTALGVGTNRWGTKGITVTQLLDTFSAAVETGVTLFDTAELYARGESERKLHSTGCCSGTVTSLRSQVRRASDISSTTRVRSTGN